MSLRKIKGTVVVRLVDVLDKRSLAMDLHPKAEGFQESITHRSISVSNSYVLALQASIQLISATKADFSEKGKLGNTVHLDGVVENAAVEDAPYTFVTYFDYDKNFGIPGAFYIKNLSTLEIEFFLVSLTLDGIPNHPPIHFVCNSWIYDAKKYQTDRIFFTNNTYLPSKTPPPLVYYRQLELQTLRGDGKGERKEWERIYDYDVYNDLGDPDNGKIYARPIAGGSSAYPYPRRGRTGRKPTKTDPNSESRSSYVYIPRDEVAVNLDFTTSVVHKLESMAQEAIPLLQSAANTNSTIEDEFRTFDDVFNLFETGEYPVPKVVEVNKTAWVTDEEFAREIIAGVNPGLIRSIKELPPKIKRHYEFEATQSNRLFLLDHYDTVMPNLRRINSTTTSRIYASKTYLFLTNDGTLKPLAIELSLPHPDGDQFGDVSEVYFPATEGTVEGSIWQLAKAYVVINDECVHQIISHWLHTHAVTEPFVIAANRQLSVVHPIYKLLHPHFRNTMNINAAARKILLNADETIYAWRKYGVEMSSILYKDWVFPEQALPTDLIKRGMAVEDPNSPHGIHLLIEDYPYAVDGLDIWGAIKTWVQEYVYLYYTSDDTVYQDYELQAWWKEVVEVGHGDKKDEKWWPKMQTRDDLIQSCVTIIWIGSALHASVNFSQYPYGGLILNRPTLSRRFMPKEGTAEYEELVNNPELAYLNTITSKPVTKVDLNMLEVLSTHSSDEYYLGQRESALYWTSDPKALESFQKFGATIAGIGDKINQRNNDKTLKNRVGPVVLPYTLLYPTSEAGITSKGVPNSISI